MKRILFAIGMAVGLSFFAAASSQAQDVVVRRDPKGGKDVSVSGTIEQESPGGVKIKVGKESQFIPAEDVLHVAYHLANVSEIEFGTPYGKEQQAMTKTGAARKLELADVLKQYQDLEKKVKGTPNALRYIQYRQAMLAVDQAKDDPAVDPVAALNAFRTANSSGWEITPATKALADLLEAKGNPAGARQAYEELAANPDASEAVQLDANLQEARLLSRDNKNADAEQKLKAVAAGLKADDPQRIYVQVALAQTQVAQGKTKEAEAPLKAAIQGAGDDHLKALAYNVLGDYYLQNKQPDEAFWQYLRVDTVYNQDREEHARALYHLWKLYETVRADQPRSNESLQKLEDKSLAGTDYQARALKEANGAKKAP
jgi:predicted negative regulator of RcsB-dependent stress response